MNLWEHFAHGSFVRIYSRYYGIGNSTYNIVELEMEVDRFGLFQKLRWGKWARLASYSKIKMLVLHSIWLFGFTSLANLFTKNYRDGMWEKERKRKDLRRLFTKLNRKVDIYKPKSIQKTNIFQLRDCYRCMYLLKKGLICMCISCHISLGPIVAHNRRPRLVSLP